jgi:hypothetical protein
MSDNLNTDPILAEINAALAPDAIAAADQLVADAAEASMAPQGLTHYQATEYLSNLAILENAAAEVTRLTAAATPLFTPSTFGIDTDSGNPIVAEWIRRNPGYSPASAALEIVDGVFKRIHGGVRRMEKDDYTGVWRKKVVSYHWRINTTDEHHGSMQIDDTTWFICTTPHNVNRKEQLCLLLGMTPTESFVGSDGSLVPEMGYQGKETLAAYKTLQGCFISEDEALSAAAAMHRARQATRTIQRLNRVADQVERQVEAAQPDNEAF